MSDRRRRELLRRAATGGPEEVTQFFDYLWRTGELEMQSGWPADQTRDHELPLSEPQLEPSDLKQFDMKATVQFRVVRQEAMLYACGCGWRGHAWADLDVTKFLLSNWAPSPPLKCPVCKRERKSA